MLVIKALIQTDLPLPVAPAIRRWGISARSVLKGSPEAVLPSASMSLASCAWKVSDSRISLRYTVEGLGLGTSMPTTALPGTGA